jgi:hypothetical protein
MNAFVKRTWLSSLLGLAALLSVLAVSGAARAQAFSRLDPGQQTVTVGTGLESGVTTSLGYAAGLRLAPLDRTLVPFIQGTLVAAHPDLGDFAVRAGAQLPILHRGWFDLAGQLAFEVDQTTNDIYRATALATDVTLLAGHFGRRWFLLGEAGYDHAWLTYLKTSDWYRTYIYSGAKDGWYGGTAGTLHAGAKGGVTLGAIEVVARAGVDESERLNALDLPFYATLGVGYRF